LNRHHSSKQVRDFIIQNVGKNPGSISHIVAEKFGISRQSVNRYLLKLIRDGLLIPEGNTRGRRYHLKSIREKDFFILITPELEEDKVWRQYLNPLFNGINSNIVNICHYGFTEMFNNIIDHSEAKSATVKFKYMPNRIEITVFDDGVGIFNKITRDLGLEDHRHAILELSKGKLTTDPEHHTGEGIFFTTRMFDEFSILSGNLYFAHFLDDDDWLLETKKSSGKGTFITMVIEPQSNRTTREVFDSYTSEDGDYSFTRMHVPVALAIYGEENLVSRSQAKRLLARFERFKEVFLDFEGVEFIGQAFADEIFRVFKNANPNIELLWMRANDNIEKMIKSVMSRSDENQLQFNLEETDNLRASI